MSNVAVTNPPKSKIDLDLVVLLRAAGEQLMTSDAMFAAGDAQDAQGFCAQAFETASRGLRRTLDSAPYRDWVERDAEWRLLRAVGVSPVPPRPSLPSLNETVRQALGDFTRAIREAVVLPDTLKPHMEKLLNEYCEPEVFAEDAGSLVVLLYAQCEGAARSLKRATTLRAINRKLARK